MNVVDFGKYLDKESRERISIDDLTLCISHLQKEAEKAGFFEISDLLALANVASRELNAK